MEPQSSKRNIARRALLGEEVEESIREAVELSPLLEGHEPQETHEDIEPLTFNAYEEAEEIRRVDPEDVGNIAQLYALKTYEDDAAHTLKESKVPLYKIKAAEVAGRQEKERAEDHDPYEKRVITIAAIVVLIVVIATITGLIVIQSLF